MAALLGVLLIFLAITGHSSATYCVCKDGVSESALQKNIDYACGAGANCSPILQNGVCYNPNTVKDHCNYAVNSYFQNKGQVNGSCDFSSTAMTTSSLPSSQSSTCVYPTSASSTTPSSGTTTSTGTNTTTGLTPNTPFGLSPPITDNSRAASVSLRQTSHLFFWPFTLTLLLSGPIFLRP